MRRFHPFVQGHVVAALMVGLAFGMIAGSRQAAGMAAAMLMAGAVVSSLVCWKWPGYEAPAWKLWPAAILANPLALAAIGFTVVHAGCFVGSGTDCLIAGFAMWVAIACVLPPLGGLAWRWWIRRRPPAPDARGSSPPPR